MRFSSFFPLAFTVAHASPSPTCTPLSDVDLHEHLLEACEPLNSTRYRNLDTACGVEASIQMQCLYQVSADNASLTDVDFPFRHAILAGNVTQRDCLCQTHIFDVIKGCSACNRAHGGRLGFGWEEPESFDIARSSYCAASSTITAGFADFMRSALETGHTNLQQSSLCSPTTTPSGSAYYTSAVPLSIANRVALLEGNATSYTNLYTSDGQIFPTPNGKFAKHGQDEGTSTVSRQDGGTSTVEAGAVPTAGFAIGALGVMVVAVVL